MQRAISNSSAALAAAARVIHVTALHINKRRIMRLQDNRNKMLRTVA